MRSFLTVAAAGVLTAALAAAPSSGRVSESTGANARPAGGAPSAAPLPNFQAKGGHLIRLLAGAFDPLSATPPVQAGIARRNEATLAAGQSQYWLVQVSDGRFAEASKAIGAAGAKVVGVVPDATYMVRATPSQRARLAQSDAVRWTGFYQPGWRLPTAQGGRKALLELQGVQTYRVYVFRDDPTPAAVGRALAQMPGVTVVEDAGAVVDVRATAAQLPSIAALPAVEWVDLKPEFKLLNANARWVTDTGVRDLYAATAPGLLTGAGQTAAVADTAVNYTTDRNGVAHIGFRDCPGGACKLADYTQAAAGNTPAAMNNVVANNTSPHRKMAAFFDIGNTGPNPGDDASHGSHTAGSVAGDQGANGIPDGHDGMAPGARLVDQNIGTAAGGLTIPSDLYDVFRQAYRPSNPASVLETSPATGSADYGSYVATEDARTHNNSWSSAIGGQVPNSALSVAVDKFVWDHEDMVIVFSAGNGGPGANTFSAPSNAKNDISSGASANGRQPMASIDSMAIFSSHGPTQDGRFGPDLATPGQIVVSTKGGTSDGYHVLQGTSMSGPVLTGLATLVRQYFWDGYAAADGNGFAAGAPSASRKHNPSAALVKATLINGAVRMRGWYTGADGRAANTDGQWPSSGQGFGRVNLDNSLYFSGDPSNAWYQDVWRGDADAFSGPATRTYQIDVQAGEPLDVTLSWTDAPNLLPAGTPALVNNLDLTVTGPGGTYVGNNMNSKVTGSVPVAETTQGAAPPDVKEVTERVRIAAPAAGTYTISVSAGAIVTGNQGFALAASGRVSAVGQSFTPGPARQADVAGSPTISNLRVEPVMSDTAIVRFTTNEPTTATATVGANTYTDSYNVGNDTPNTGGGGGFIGLNEGQVETSAEYANKPVLGTQHEVLLTGIPPGALSIGVTATDLDSNATPGAVAAATASGVFGADAPDIGQLLAATTPPSTSTGWKTGTQLYAGVSGTTTALGAFMFRVPETLDPATITGATVELTSAHDLVSRYTQDPLLYVDLLDSGVEAAWGTQTHEQIRAAAAAARVFPETTHKRGGGSTYAFTFSCMQLQALKDTLSEVAVGGRKAAFRWDSTSTGLFSMEPGFNRRSNGPDRRPRLVLFTEGTANPYGRTCDPAAPAPTISGVGIHEGSTAGSVTVSWETNSESDSMVLVRKKSETSWTQVGTPALTKIHQVQLSGLDFSQDYVFVVRSAGCNGKATTDTNDGHGYGFFKTVTLGAGTQDAFFDFEDGAPGWTATTTTTQDPDIEPNTTWTLKSPGHESQIAWNAEPYGDLDTAVLTSPPVTLTGTVASVEFFVRHDFEQQPTPVFTTSDGLHVEYSADGGGTWNNIAFYQGQSPNYPAFQPKQSSTFATPDGGVLLRFKAVSDDNVSTPPFQGAAVDRVKFISYTPSGAPGGDSDRPLSGPATPPSAGLTGLAAPKIRKGPASDADQAAGTGMCGVVGPAEPDLRITGIVANGNKKAREGEKVTVTATVTNTGDATAAASKTQFLLDGTTVLGLADTDAIAAGASKTVSVFWDTRKVKGEHLLRVTADQAPPPNGLVDESNEANNASTLTVTVKGNEVKNGSFEEPNAAGAGPDSWTGQSSGAGTTSWSDGGSDGLKSASTSGTGGNAGLAGSPSWTSAPVAVTAGETLDLVVSVNALGVSSAPTAGLAFIGAAGQVLNTVKLITAPTLTLGFQKLEQSVTIPAGAMQTRVVLTGFAPTDVRTAGTVTFDDVGLFAR